MGFRRSSTLQMLALATAIFCLNLAGSTLRAQSFGTNTMVANQQPEGVLVPWKASYVACAESGLISSLLVQPGDRVQAGDLLAQLDCTLAEIQLEAARVQAAARGKLNQVRAEMELAEKKVLSIQQAREKNHSTQSEIDRALAELKIIEGRHQAELDDLQVLVLQANRMEKLLEQRKVIAPIDGIVEKIAKSAGEYVSPNSPEVVRVVDVSKLRASFFLQLQEAQSLKVASKVKVDVSGNGLMEAVVEHIAPFPDGGSGLIEVHVLVENPDMKILGSRCNLILEPSAELVSGR